ncbi:EamA family transporter [Mesoterricola sediminis]|uniref:EamA domain-containing protein n=1 Tax=Mesoterricola sediminis TaxID=2927980 RepID=A0AA48GYN1_9BACT|nr:EamA family transporter [Mesoterricola sediminis]BDU78689.1 hypothetical protein METESE_36470 [Mesoterricola sediminis]
MIERLLYAYLAVLLTAVAQVLLKRNATRTRGASWLMLYGSPAALAAWTAMAAAFLVNLYAYATLPLRFAAVVQPFNYVLVGAFSWVFLGERLSRRQWAGAAIILVGVALFNL